MKQICKFCNKEFEPIRDWQRFCCPEHQKQYWKDTNPFHLKKEIQELKDKIKQIENKEDS